MKQKLLSQFLATTILLFLIFVSSQAWCLKEWDTDEQSIRLYVFNTGFGILPRSHLKKGGDKTKVKVPILAFIIKHPKGLIAVDTGFSHLFVTDPKKYAGVITYKLFFKKSIIMQPGQDLPTQMHSVGLKPEDVKYVVLTHANFDHTGEVEAFKNAKILISKNDFKSLKNDWALWHGYRKEDVLGNPNIETLSYDDNSNYEMFPKVNDLFGDQTVLLIPTPGHTPGSQSVLINLNGKKVLLPGDAVYLCENFTRPIPKGRVLMRSTDDEKDQAWESILAIRQFWKTYPDALIIPSHDYLLFTVLQRAPSYYY